ncbi:hypothetical protein Tco_0519074, partial [Tanacetum coccineum]
FVLVTIDRHEWFASPQIYTRDDDSGLWIAKRALPDVNKQLVNGVNKDLYADGSMFAEGTLSEPKVRLIRLRLTWKTLQILMESLHLMAIRLSAITALILITKKECVPLRFCDVVMVSPIVTNTVANHAEKPEKFNGQNFKRWQQKMFFHLGTLNLAWFLNETAPQSDIKGSAPELVKREIDTRVTCTVDAFKHSETLCAITMRYMLRMERLNLGNSPTTNIKGKGDVIHI